MGGLQEDRVQREERERRRIGRRCFGGWKTKKEGWSACNAFYDGLVDHHKSAVFQLMQ